MVPQNLKPARRCSVIEAKLRGIADDGDHQPEAFAVQASISAASSKPADAFALRIRGNIDGILHREAIGGARAVGAGVGVARDAAVELGDEIGIASVGDGPEAAQHLRLVGRLQLEAGRALR